MKKAFIYLLLSATFLTGAGSKINGAEALSEPSREVVCLPACTATEVCLKGNIQPSGYYGGDISFRLKDLWGNEKKVNLLLGLTSKGEDLFQLMVKWDGSSTSYYYRIGETIFSGLSFPIDLRLKSADSGQRMIVGEGGLQSLKVYKPGESYPFAESFTLDFSGLTCREGDVSFEVSHNGREMATLDSVTVEGDILIGRFSDGRKSVLPVPLDFMPIKSTSFQDGKLMGHLADGREVQLPFSFDKLSSEDRAEILKCMSLSSLSPGETAALLHKLAGELLLDELSYKRESDSAGGQVTSFTAVVKG
jgi:hypothetical protein